MEYTFEYNEQARIIIATCKDGKSRYISHNYYKSQRAYNAAVKRSKSSNWRAY